jgi:uncharacterized protein (TIGR02996 family)
VTERDCFIRRICEEPGCDTHRLVYADWCDENGEPERAQFIRWAVRHPENSGVCLCCDPRERPCAMCETLACPALDALRRANGETHYIQTRGFVTELRCSLASFMFIARTGAIFAAHPVTRVVPSDAEPWENDEASPPHWRWQSDRRWEPVCARIGGLPLALIKRVPRHPKFARLDRATGRDARCVLKSFPTAGDAVEALSVGCVAYGRSLAGLPALPAAGVEVP